MSYVSEYLVHECLKWYYMELYEGHGWVFGAVYLAGSKASSARMDRIL